MPEHFFNKVAGLRSFIYLFIYLFIHLFFIHLFIKFKLHRYEKSGKSNILIKINTPTAPFKCNPSKTLLKHIYVSA